MPKKRTLLPALGLLVLSTAACDGGGRKTPTEVQFQGTVNGMVEVEGAGQQGVTVHLSGGVVREAQTAASGGFSFTGLPAGSYVITITGQTDDADFPSTSQSTVLSQAHGTAALNFLGTFKTDASIGGTVTLNGAGAGGMLLTATGPSPSTTSTDGQGAYELSGLKRGDYTVTLSGFDPQLHSFPVTAQTVQASDDTPVGLDFAGALIPQAPRAPTGLWATATGSGTIDLGWTDTSDDETRFEIFRRLGADGEWGVIEAPGPNTTSFQDEGLSPSTAYSYRVRACNDAGCSGFSEESTATTEAAPPNPPSALAATADGPFTIQLTWNDQSDNEVRFEVERDAGLQGEWAAVGTVDPDVASFGDTDLTPNTSYGYRVRACNEAGCSPWSDQATATTDEVAPEAPSELSASATGSSTVDLAWTDRSDNETRFEVERDAGIQGTWVAAGTVDPDETSFGDSGLAPVTDYGYRVRACNQVGCSPWSNQADATTSEVPPEPPSALGATATGSSSAEVTWTDRSDNETRFEVERRRIPGGKWDQVSTRGADVTGFSDTGLAPGTTYRYRARACNAVGCSAYSNVDDATTDDVAPQAPSDLEASASSTSRVDLAWSDDSSNEDDFRLERKIGIGGTWTQAATLGANTTTFSDTGLSPGTTYRYRVRACNTEGCSSFSNEDGATTQDVPPEAPSGLGATAASTSEVDLAWTDESSNEDGFRVERKTGAGGTFAQIASVGANTSSFSDDGLAPSTTYFYRVTAFNGEGESPPSNETSATTPAAEGLNLTIATLYLTQSTQTLDSDVPAVADKDGYLRVFAVASESNSSQPSVRVEFYLGGVLAHTETISAPGSSVPTSVQESPLGTSWNVAVPAALMQPGLTIVAEVDSGHDVAESNEADNLYPVGGSPLSLDVRSTSTFDVTFVPVRQSVNGTVGNVSAGNVDDFLDVTLEMLPVAAANAQVHSEYVTAQPALESDNGNGAWGGILSEINSLRVAEGTSRYYYGVVRTTYGSGVAGMGYLGWPTAIGWDHLPSGSAVAAHEWGHNWDLAHAPGCGAASPDPSFPYADGKIGVWGLDVTTTSPRSPSTYYDFMSYCGPDWISDYHYEKILEYRELWGGMGAPAQPEPSLLVWGRVEDGTIVLEPAFEITTVPVLPDDGGELLLEAVGPDGQRLFSRAFQPLPIPDATDGDGHFAFAIPLRFVEAQSLSGLRVSGGGMSPAIRETRVGPRMAAPAEPRLDPRPGGAVEVTWDGASFPMALIRDPASGQILSFARGGSVTLPASPDEIEMVFSDGLRSPDRVRRIVR